MLALMVGLTACSVWSEEIVAVSCWRNERVLQRLSVAKDARVQAVTDLKAKDGATIPSAAVGDEGLRTPRGRARSRRDGGLGFDPACVASLPRLSADGPPRDPAPLQALSQGCADPPRARPALRLGRPPQGGALRPLLDQVPRSAAGSSVPIEQSGQSEQSEQSNTLPLPLDARGIPRLAVRPGAPHARTDQRQAPRSPMGEDVHFVPVGAVRTAAGSAGMSITLSMVSSFEFARLR